MAALTWADIRRVVVDGGLAYGPQLRWSVQCDRAWLDSIKDSPPPFPGLPPAVVHRQLLADDDGSRERWWFLQWGPTTDNVLTHLFHDGDHLVITEEFCREDHLRRHPEHIEAVFVAEISRCSPP